MLTAENVESKETRKQERWAQRFVAYKICNINVQWLRFRGESKRIEGNKRQTQILQ